MRINADFDQPVMLDTADMDWVASPMAGVERKMLDRIGEEVARATSLVRYAPGSYFSAHTHGGGEEFLVLEGVFSDEHGDYPAGSYVRNPIGTSHTPHSDPGCVILVKLHQFDANDGAQFHRDWTTGTFTEDAPGVTQLPLHRHGGETVRMERWQAGASRTGRFFPAGAEIFVVDGALTTDQGLLPSGGWLRLPAGTRLGAATEAGCLLYVKTGHLGAPAR